MKKFILIFFIPVLASAQEATLEKFVDSLLATSQKGEMPAQYALIAKDGKPLVRKAYGYANLELSVPAKPEHLFTLASVNKQMISIAILKLSAAGKLNLDDDIRKYLPKFNTHGHTITIEHLLTHTSGIYSETGATGAKGKTLYDLTLELGLLSEDDFMNYVMQHDLFFEPGTDWGWNTFAYHLAFFIIEKASGMRFNDYMREHLFKPAGMNNTFSKIDGNRLGMFGIKNLVSNYYAPDADGKLVWKDFRRFSPYLFYERYAIATCLDDLMKWDAALREGKIIDKKLLEKAWTPFKLKSGASTNYGYGWMISEYAGHKILASIGIGTNPICTVHVPDRNIYIVYTQFYGVLEQAELIVKKILAKVLNGPYPQVEKTQAPLTEYTGVYEIHRMGLRTTEQLSDGPMYLRVTTSGDTLYIQQTGSERSWLRPAGKDQFLPARSEGSYYIFTRNAAGNVDAVKNVGTMWSYGQEVRNKKVKIEPPQPIQPKSISPQKLASYVGSYYDGSLDTYRFIEADGGKLFNKVQGMRQELIAVADNKFVRKGVEDVTYEFVNDANGSSYMIVKGLRTSRFRKVD
jgi:CubicO group peptidase (beta-lactamase class C family)